MQWRDEGILVSVRSHGETSAIVEILTAAHGRHVGVVRGGASRKMKAFLQPGTDVSVTWTARLESHMGAFVVEPIRSRMAAVLRDRMALEAVNAVCALICWALPERESMPDFHAETTRLLNRICADEGWLADYVIWEMSLLTALGFGLDLSACAATGVNEDLAFVSPRTGRAVSRDGAGPWADRLLDLPAFLTPKGGGTDAAAIIAGLRLTGYFLDSRAAGALGRDSLPAARARLVSLVERAAPPV